MPSAEAVRGGLPIPLVVIGARGGRSLLAPGLLAVLLLLFLLERLLLHLPAELAMPLGGLLAAVRLYGDPALRAPWQLWSGGLVLHDWLQALLALPVWLVWGRACEIGLGRGRFLLLLLLGLPAYALLTAVVPVAQPVLPVAIGHCLLIGAAAAAWPGARVDLRLLRLRRGALVLHARRWPLWTLSAGLVVAELLRAALLHPAGDWRGAVVTALQVLLAVAGGLLVALLILQLPGRIPAQAGIDRGGS